MEFTMERGEENKVKSEGSTTRMKFFMEVRTEMKSVIEVVTEKQNPCLKVANEIKFVQLK